MNTINQVTQQEKKRRGDAAARTDQRNTGRHLTLKEIRQCQCSSEVFLRKLALHQILNDVGYTDMQM